MTLPDVLDPRKQEDYSLIKDQILQPQAQPEAPSPSPLRQVQVTDYWNDPRRVARYYDALQTLPPGSQLPPWLDAGKITKAYNYLSRQNQGKAWWQWQPLADDDPMRQELRFMTPPPADAMTPDEQTQNWGGVAPAPNGSYAVPFDQASQYFPPDFISSLQSDAAGNVIVPAEYIGADYSAPSAYTPSESATQDLVYGMPRENFEKLPAWQQAVIPLMPWVSGGMGALQGAVVGTTIAPGVGTVVGAGVGAGVTYAAEHGYDLWLGDKKITAEEYAALTPEEQAQVKQKPGGLAKALNLLDMPAEAVERVVGFLSQGIDALSTGEQFNASAAWKAAKLTYDVSFAGQLFDEQGNVVNRDRYIKMTPEERAKVRTGIQGWDGIWYSPQGEAVSSYALKLARDRIAAGEDLDTVWADVGGMFGLSGQLRDMVGHMALDPLNLVGGLAAKGIGFGADLMKNATLAKAMEGKNDILPGLQQYGAAIRGMEPAQASQFTWLSRQWAGIADDGNLKAYARGVDTRKGIAGMWDRLAGLDPKSRANEALNNASQGIRLLMNDINDPDQMTKTALSLTRIGLEDAVKADLPGFLEAADMQPVALGMRALRKPIEELSAKFTNSREQHDLIANVARLMGKEPEALLAELHKATPNQAEDIYTQFINALQKRAAGDPAANRAPDAQATALLQTFAEGGTAGLDGKTLKLMAEGFTRENNPLPWNDTMYKTQLVSLMEDGIAQWAVDWFGVKPEAWFLRLSNVVKRAQSLLLLGYNPSYMMNNAINNFVTLAWDGALSLNTRKARMRFFEELGVSPAALRKGQIAFADIDLSGANDNPIRAALRGKDALQKVADATGKVNNLPSFVTLSGKIEELSSEMALYAGMREYWERAWQPGKGFDRMDTDLARALDAVQPGLSSRVQRAITRGKNKAEVEKEIFQDFGRKSLHNVLSADDKATMAAVPGLFDDIEDGLKTAETPDQVREVFRAARAKAAAEASRKVVENLRVRAEEAAAKARVEGVHGALDVFDSVSQTRFTFWIEHFRKMDEVSRAAGAAPDNQTAHLIWDNAFRESARAWNDFTNQEGAKFLGVVRGMGADADEVLAIETHLTEIHDLWGTFYAERRKMLADHFLIDWQNAYGSNWKTVRNEHWAELQTKLAEMYSERVELEADVQHQIDVTFADQFERQFTGGRDAALAWRQGVARVRKDMTNAITYFRTGKGEIDPAVKRTIDRMKAQAPGAALPWNEFIAEVYAPLIRKYTDAQNGGARGMYMHPGGTGPRPDGGPAPADAPTPRPSDAPTPRPAEQAQPAATQQPEAQPEAQPEMAQTAAAVAPAQPAPVQPSPAPQPAQATGRASEIIAIAQEFGVHTATSTGRTNNRYLLAIMNKYAGIKAKYLDDLQPDQVRAALQKWHEAHAADNVRDMINERAAEVEDGIGYVQSEVEAIATPDPAAQPRALAMPEVGRMAFMQEARATVGARADQVTAVTDAIANYWAKINGSTRDDWYRTFGLKRAPEDAGFDPDLLQLSPLEGTRVRVARAEAQMQKIFGDNWREMDTSTYQFDYMSGRINGAQWNAIYEYREAKAYLAAMEAGEFDSYGTLGRFIKKGGGEYLYQAAQTGKLIAVHNLSAQKLIDANELGGMPVPSIAIIKPDQQFTEFGDITLVGNRPMIDPGYGGHRVFDADIYSARKPDKIWKKVPTKKARPIIERIQAASDEIDNPRYYEIWEALVEYPNKEKALSLMDQDAGARLTFLRENGIDVQPIRANIHPEFPATPELQAWMAEHADEMPNASPGEPIYTEFSNLARQALGEDYSDWFHENGEIKLPYYDRAAQMATREKRGETTRIDRYKTGEAIREAFTPELEQQYEAWAKDLLDVFDAPMIELDGRKVPYSLYSVVNAMTKKKIRGAEDTLTFGPGKVRAMAARELESIDQMHKAEGNLRPTAEVHKHIEETQKPIVDRYQNQVLDYYQYSDRWSALDDSMKVLADYLGATRTRNPEKMRAALRKNDFINLTDDIVEAALDAADAMRGTPVDYFEAKPQRAVRFGEWTGAVIPDDAPAAVREILDSRGIEYQTYPAGDKAARQAAVQKFYDREGVLFQDAQTRPAPADLAARIEERGFVPVDAVLDVFGQDMPEHLTGVIEFLTRQRKKYNDGKMTVRDVAKAYLITTSSIGSDAQPLSRVMDRFQAAGIQFTRDGQPLDLSYYTHKGNWTVAGRVQSTDTVMIRPEEAAAAWLMTDQGRAALDALERGEITPAWVQFAEARRSAYGRFERTIIEDRPTGKAMNFQDIAELTRQINEAAGDPDKIALIVQQTAGISGGKSGFIKHLLGFGDEITLDTQEVNFWANRMPDRPLSEEVLNKWRSKAGSAVIKREIEKVFQQLKERGVLDDLSEDQFNHVMHHWLWDAQKGTATTHQGLYRTMDLAQGVKGSTTWLDNGQAVIRAYQSADVSTLVHEVAHVWLPQMPAEDIAVVSKWLKDEYNLDLAEGWQYGARDNVQAKEYFARGFERYLAEGKAPTPALQKVFESFKQWMLEIYRSITGSDIDIKLNDDIRSLFDKWMGAEQAAAQPQATSGRTIADVAPPEGIQTLRDFGYSDSDIAEIAQYKPDTQAPSQAPEVQDIAKLQDELRSIEDTLTAKKERQWLESNPAGLNVTDYDSKAGTITVNGATLQRIGSGAEKDVFDLGDGRVLKIDVADWSAGKSPSLAEGVIASTFEGAGSEFMPRVFGAGKIKRPDTLGDNYYIIMERADPFEIGDLASEGIFYTSSAEVPDEIKSSSGYQGITGKLASKDKRGDYRFARNWGKTADGRTVVIDINDFTAQSHVDLSARAEELRKAINEAQNAELFDTPATQAPAAQPAGFEIRQGKVGPAKGKYAAFEDGKMLDVWHDTPEAASTSAQKTLADRADATARNNAKTAEIENVFTTGRVDDQAAGVVVGNREITMHQAAEHLRLLLGQTDERGALKRINESLKQNLKGGKINASGLQVYDPVDVLRAYMKYPDVEAKRAQAPAAPIGPAAEPERPNAWKPKPRQQGFFESGEDTPLFTGTAQTARDEVFNPAEAAPQDALFNMREQLPTIEGKQVEGEQPAGPLFDQAPGNTLFQRAPRQRGMFESGEDLPLFSGTPMRADEQVFRPEAPRPAPMPDRSEVIRFMDNDVPVIAQELAEIGSTQYRISVVSMPELNGREFSYLVEKRAGDQWQHTTAPIKAKQIGADLVARQKQPALFQTSRETTAIGADPSNTYQFRFKVVDLKDLITSHTDKLEENPAFPQELQPRQRGRFAGREQVDRIARELNADAMLTDTKTLDRGPMIVGADNIVESGNGRTIALRRAASQYPERYAEYTDALRGRLADYGLTDADLEGIEQPVLVRERISDVDRAKFAAEANQAGIMRMSDYEQSLQDANNVTDSMLGALEIGDSQSIEEALQTAKNMPLVHEFMNAMPENDRPAMQDAGGKISQPGIRRIKDALFAKVYSTEHGLRLLQMFSESVDPVIANVKNAMYGALGLTAKADGLMKSGARDPQLSITEDITRAADVYSRLKQAGENVDAYIAQNALFENELTPLQMRLLEFFNKNGRRQKNIRELLKAYAQEIIDQPPPQDSLFAMEPVTKGDIFDAAIKKITLEEDAPPAGWAAAEKQARTTAADQAAAGEINAGEGEALPPADLEAEKAYIAPVQTGRNGLDEPSAQPAAEPGAQPAQPGQRRTRRPRQPAPEAVGSPIGTVDSLLDPPLDEAAFEGWMKEIAPLLDRAERGVLEDPGGTLEGVPAEAMRGLRSYIGKVSNQMADTKMAAMRYGTARRNFSLLDYNKRRGVENLASTVFPYQFWYTHSMLNWGLRAVTKPQILANYYRLQNMTGGEMEREGFPTRLKGKVAINAPWLDDWMGEGIYMNPMRQVFPFMQLTRPFEALAEQKNQVDKRAESIIYQMIGDEQISEDEARQALESKRGAIYERARAQAMNEVDAEITGPLDFAFTVSGPSLPLSIAMNYSNLEIPGVYKGSRDRISQLPVTKMVQNATAALGIGGPRGVNLERGIRKAAGLPEMDRYEDYRVDRMLANMTAEGLITSDQATRAMIDRQGAEFEAAQRRVTQMGLWQYLGAPLSVDFFPEGEQTQRQLKHEYDRAISAWKESGDTKALSKFFDRYPEYQARMVSFQEPEERLKRFVIAEVWNKWNELPAVHKEQVEEQLGDVFTDGFINKETRSYDAISLETLATWARMMKAQLPEKAPETPAIPLKLADKAIADQVEAYNKEKRAQFPNIGQITGMYYSLPDEQKPAFERQFPAVQQYNQWRTSYLAEHPDVIPWVTSEDNKLADLPATIQARVYKYRAERDKNYPNIFQVQEEYFKIPEDDIVSQRVFKAEHPELQKYWDWRKEFASQNTTASPYILGEDSLANAILGRKPESTTRVDGMTKAQAETTIQGFSKELVRVWFAHIYDKRQLGQGSLAELGRIWEDQGKPMGSLAAWIKALEKLSK